MMKFWLFLSCVFFLSGCVLKGTDSGNPGTVASPVDSSLCTDETKAECGQDNPAVYLIDQGFCQNLDRCASELRSADCRSRALDTNVLPDFYEDAGSKSSREFAIRVGEKKITVQPEQLRSCVQALTANACSQLPLVPDQSSESLRLTFRQMLTANSECAEVFK